MKRFIARLGFVALLLGPAVAEAQSAADISAMVDEKMDSIDEFATLLNDPDPQRALTAMNIMIAHEDPQISRMALQFGLTSTSPAVRRAALKAYFDTAPMLNIYFDGSSIGAEKLAGSLDSEGGTVDAKGEGFLAIKLGEFDDSKNCYVYQRNASYCLIGLSESNVALFLWQKAASLTLNAEGNLEGVVFVKRLRPAIPVTIPIRP